MPTYEITSPDGKTFEVTAPEGASKDDVLRYAQSQFKAPRSRNLLDALDAIDKQQPAQQEPAPYQGANYIGQQLKKGVAAGLGAPVDAITNLLNLGIAGYGVAKHELTGSANLPGLVTNPVGGSGTFERLFLTNNDVQPTGPVNAVAGRFARDIGAASVPIAGMAGKPASFLPRNAGLPAVLQAETQSPIPLLAAGTGLQLAASTGGQLARSVVPEPYKDTADFAGQLLGGVAIPAYIAARVQAFNALRKAGSSENANRIATNVVENKLRGDIRNFPGAKEKLQEALDLSDEIPGFKPRIGQASNVPSVIDMERRVATSGPEQFNKRAVADEANRLAIQKQAEQDLPLLAGKSDIAERLATTQTERQSLADALPEVAAEETGQTLRAARSSLKGRYDQIAAQKFNAPVEEAKRLGVKVNPQEVFDKVDDLFKDPILQYDARNAPAIMQRIKAVIGREEPGSPPQIVGERGEPLYAPRDRVFNIDFADLKAMREAIGQDIAAERTSPSPMARQRLRKLIDIQNSIDDVAEQAPKAVTSLWNSARDWYASEYAPKFLRGINLKQSLRDITGEQRIADERLPAQYFKKGQSTPMNRFVTLYGDSPQAMHAMENHILDSYRKEVVRDGVIDPNRHEAFVRNYEPALKQLPSIRENLDSMGNAARLLSAREEQLSQAQSLLTKGQLSALKYEDHGSLGLDPSKIESFLGKNKQAFRDAVSSVYGEKVANEHLANLEKFAKAAAIADRGKLSPNAYPEQSTNPLDLRSRLGFTGRTIFSMWRAVTTGRTSAEDVAYTLGAQGISHRVRMALIAAEERAVSDPETARLIAQSINQPATSELGKLTLRKILEKGGMYLTGANQYDRMSRYRVAPTAVQATQQGREAGQ